MLKLNQKTIELADLELVDFILTTAVKGSVLCVCCILVLDYIIVDADNDNITIGLLNCLILVSSKVWQAL
jgi:hypothetical protein